MVTIFLYLATALATAVQVWWLLAWSMWGAPTSPFQYAALYGSLSLFVAALVFRWKPYLATIIALCSCVIIWSFYLPALYYTLIRLPSIHKAQAFVPQLILALIPAVLLLLSSIRTLQNLTRGVRTRLTS